MYKWSFDFEVISLLMTVLLLIDIKASKLLPSKSTRLFLHTIGTQIALIASDFIASLLDNYAKGKFIGFQIFINTVYFALIFFFMASLHIFLRFFSFEKRGLFFKLKPYDFIPCAIANVFLIANLFTNVVFKIDSAGFFRGRLYYYIIYPYMIVELAICAITIARGRNYIIGKVRAGIYLSLAMITCVSAYQVYFKPGRLIMNLGFSSGLVIMYVVFVSTEDNKETKTSTFNPNGFYKYMRERIMSGSPFKVFFIKIQNYSSVLATYGRENTDELLRQIGVDLKKKEQRTFYLHAGLFAIVPENQSYYMIDEVLVNDVTSKERSLDDAQVDLSYRIVTCDESARFYSPQEMLESVSDAVDDPKCDKPQFSPISSDDIAKTIRKSEFYKSIFNALENGGVRVYYQPIFDNSLGRISSAEALVRIYDKKLGLIYPDNFISLFEKNGSILKMGLIVFAKVCSFIRDNDMAALGLNYIEVNLSPIQCMQPSLPDDLISIAESYGVDLKYINFEVTETAAIPTEMLRHLMTTLISHGATFSVDDFGTGYSNIIRLANMPFSIIKIDKSILWNYFKTRDDLVPRIYEMLNIEGYNLVTEGVETDEMHLWLRDVAHCKYEQGYLYSKPIDEDNFKKYLSEHNCRPISAPVKKSSPAGESMAAM